ncbi:MAG: hypothetical protein Q7S40_14365 [Opitutaceae bacterium]|nr:hypothetical protein [Opitutaceae bacterium]
MGFVHYNQVVVLGVANFVETAGSYDARVLEIDLANGVIPSLHERGWHDEERRRVMTGDVAVGVVKALGDKRCDEGFAEANDVGEKEAAVPLKFGEAVADGITLISEFLETRGQVFKNAGVVLNGGAEIFGEEFDEEIVRRE